MRKRKSGWYRVKTHESYEWELAEFSEDEGGWLTQFCIGWDYSDPCVVDERMIMTQEGELVYRGAEHDPVYNTQQEG